ncbi:NUDIX hydrolase [Thalassobacillus pellis]|uniref:NUDIX hydrolase n=1 Tax=Thalassobacillus pellis TaxID=748008 RepID=UPI001960E257|nr:NUDIX domain-containing protein [Thalassobacillus pellis]MBM7551241.1 NADH pyrophosphatase NudC (nudix superfamily) [Thalassobacillus pellis]
MSHLFVVNVEAAIVRGQEFLIIKRAEKEVHAGGLYSLVGGKMDFDASSLQVLEENVKREVAEEIGVALHDPLTYIHSNTFKAGDTQVLNIVFLSEHFNGLPYVKSKEEISEVTWMDGQEILQSSVIPTWTKNSVELSIRSLKQKRGLEQ